MVIRNNKPIEYRLNYKSGGHTKIIFIGGGCNVNVYDLLSTSDILNSNDLRNGWISVVEEKVKVKIKNEVEVIISKITDLSKAKEKVENFSKQEENKIKV